MKVPILFIIFNRPDIALKSFRQIREYKPENLYIAADGPRENRENEDELCKETRNAILNAIDWECNVHKLFREKNVGVDFGVYTAINWMFETEKWGVIIEDDCILSLDFFHFCEEAFPRYEHEMDLVHIAANNKKPREYKSSKIDVVTYPASWGWATWGEKWKKTMNPEMPGIQNATLLKLVCQLGIVRGIMYHKYWHKTYQFRNELKTWDSIWQYSVMFNKKMCLMPSVNLAINNGIGTSDGTHFKKGEKNYFEDLKMGSLSKPYVWPDCLKPNWTTIQREKIQFIGQRLFGLKKKLGLI